MPFFKDLKDLRRRSRASFRSTDKSSSNSNSTISTVPTAQSTSTLSSYYGSTTPPSTLQPHSSSPNLLTPNGLAPDLPKRPSASSAQSRYSIMGLGSANGLMKAPPPTSPYAPQILSVTDNSWVHQKVLLVYGQIGDPAQQAIDGSVSVNHHQDGFPSISWPVCDSHFKALVHLTPGPNRLRFDFTSTKRPSHPTPNSMHASFLNVNYLPLDSAPPLQLVILLGKDSPATFDAVPERIQREGNGLDTAIRKFRTAAYLWQSFTGEQMYRNMFGRRCFRFEEEWQPGTLSSRDRDSGQMRNEARIHVVRSDKTVAQIRDLEIAQQYEPAGKKGELFSIAMDAVRRYFNPTPNQKQYVACLFMDTTWDKKKGVVRGHAALGGGDGNIQLAIFGSHALQSFPACLEDVVSAFSDCTRTDTNYVVNDCNESGSNWEAANIGIGAFLHEVGHLFGSPHQESGIMLRDYVRLNRTFLCREPFSTRTKSPGQRLCLPKDECAWHRLDCLRFRYHPCFKIPTDPVLSSDGSVQVWAVESGNVMVTATTGIAFIEIFSEGDDLCRSHIEYIDGNGSGGPLQQVMLTEADLRSRLPADRQKKRIKLDIFAAGQGKHTVEDFSALASKSSLMKLPNGRAGFRGSKLGFSQTEGSQAQDLILENVVHQTKLMLQIKVFHGFALDGIEFIYEDHTTQLFGKRGGKPSIFSLDTRRGETLMGFYLRAGLWIDGVEILTSTGRRSGVFGNATGGSGHTLIPPRGYTIAGIAGSCGQWVDGFSLIITR